jgi:hypothetical protein
MWMTAARRLRLVAVFGLAMALLGCGPHQQVGNTTIYTVPDEVMAAYRNAPICCSAISEFQFTPLALPGSVETKLDSSSPAFGFDTGKSHFLAYRLPEAAEAYDVEVYSYFHPMKRTYIFQPVLVVLDSDFKTVRSVGPEAFRYSGEQWWGSQYISGRISFPQSAGPRREKYLLILTTEALLQTGLSVRGSRDIAAGGIILTGYVPEVLRYGPISPGSVSLRLIPKR